MRRHVLPEVVTVDKSGASSAALDALKEEPVWRLFKKGQMIPPNGQELSAAELFSSLAA